MTLTKISVFLNMVSLIVIVIGQSYNLRWQADMMRFIRIHNQAIIDLRGRMTILEQHYGAHQSDEVIIPHSVGM